MADIDLKTLTPDTSLPTTGFLFGADSQASTNPSVYGVTTAITAILGNAASSDVLSFNSDTIVLRDATNILAQRNGVTSQAKRVYNTYTDASNYERGVFDWKTTANTLTIGVQRAGTGVARVLSFVDAGGTERLKITGGTGIVTVAGVEISTSSSIAVFSAEAAGYTFRYVSGANSDMIIRFTGITSSFPALKRSTTFLQARLADDTGFTGFAAANVQAATAYTVATLPGTPGTGMIARVSDALAPAIGTTVAAGGAAYALVNYNGANWTVIGV
jgi:hypothetical protein